MNLPKGITGFTRYTDPPLPSTDEQVFRTVCHAVALALNGDVDYVEPVAKHREKNFSIVTIATHDQHVSVLLHAHYPYLAFASPLSRDQNAISFVDWPAGSNEFRRRSDYTILTTQELATPFSQTDTSSLADAEREQIKYWRPKTVGEIIFNFWD